MKYIILLGIFLSSFTFGASLQYKVEKTIQTIQPQVSEKLAEVISTQVIRQSKQLNMPWELFLAILWQESSVQLDPQGCLEGASCKDFGIGQINWTVWGEELDLQRRRLLKDPVYALTISAKILKHYQLLFSHKEINWFSRYHSSTPHYRQLYEELVLHKHDKIASIFRDLELKYEQIEKATYDYPHHIPERSWDKGVQLGSSQEFVYLLRRFNRGVCSKVRSIFQPIAIIRRRWKLVIAKGAK